MMKAVARFEAVLELMYLDICTWYKFCESSPCIYIDIPYRYLHLSCVRGLLALTLE